MGGNEPANLGSLCGEKGLSPSRENSAKSLSEERSPVLVGSMETETGAPRHHCGAAGLQAATTSPGIFPGRQGEHHPLVGPFHRLGFWRLSHWGPGSWLLVHSDVCPSGSFRASRGLRGRTVGQLTSGMPNRDLDGLQKLSRCL